MLEEDPPVVHFKLEVEINEVDNLFFTLVRLFLVGFKAFIVDVLRLNLGNQIP